MSKTPLDRFIEAQEPVFERVVEELTGGRKRSHWMWFVFPQIDGLGHSPLARHYAIRDLDEAKSYLGHSVLGERLRKCCSVLLTHRDKTAHEIFGSPDDLKFRSCLTLFLHAAESVEDRELFSTALETFYHGLADEQTIEILETRSGA
jgi:uncharacterized protein (DUF1810 family)